MRGRVPQAHNQINRKGTSETDVLWRKCDRAREGPSERWHWKWKPKDPAVEKAGKSRSSKGNSEGLGRMGRRWGVRMRGKWGA